MKNATARNIMQGIVTVLYFFLITPFVIIFGVLFWLISKQTFMQEMRDVFEALTEDFLDDTN